MSQKNLRILWLYPNQHMRVTPPGGVAIISACLKREGFYNMELFDATWYPVDNEASYWNFLHFWCLFKGDCLDAR